MNTELLACRAELSKALQELESRRELGRIDQRRIDEARAIARQYRQTHTRCYLHARGPHDPGGEGTTDLRCAMCIAIDALPWPKDDA